MLDTDERTLGHLPPWWRYAWHDTSCGKFGDDNRFYVERGCTCGLADLLCSGEPCLCRTCEASRGELNTNESTPP